MKNRIIILSCLCCGLFFGFKLYLDNNKKEDVIMAPEWMMFSNDDLVKYFEDDALKGRERALFANQAIYQRIYLSCGNFSSSKKYIEEAELLGDPEAAKILADPEKYYREFRARLGEKVPIEFKLK